MPYSIVNYSQCLVCSLFILWCCLRKQRFKILVKFKLTLKKDLRELLKLCLFLFVILSFCLCLSVCLCHCLSLSHSVCALCIRHDMCEGQRTTWGFQFSPSTMRIPAIKLKLARLVANNFICWASSLVPNYPFFSFLSLNFIFYVRILCLLQTLMFSILVCVCVRGERILHTSIHFYAHVYDLLQIDFLFI